METEPGTLPGTAQPAEVGRRARLRRGLGAVTTRAITAAGLSLPRDVAEAGEDMCDGDPIIWVDGQLVQIVVSIPRAALAWVTRSNPVRIRVNTPGNVITRIVGDTGDVPELVEFNPVNAPASGPVTNLDFALFFPQATATSRYGASFTATSLLESSRGAMSSGSWQSRSVRVPRVPLPSTNVATASVMLLAPGLPLPAL